MSTSKIWYKKGYKYQLYQTYSVKISIKPKTTIFTDWIWLNTEGLLTIHKGYAWDGASGPTFDTKNSMRGSLVHDSLYQLMRMGLLDRKWREQADRELERICVEDGMSKIRARIWYCVVQKIAGFGAKPGYRRKVLTAP